MDVFNRTAMNFLGRNILQTISENVTLFSEEFDMDDVIEIDDLLPMDNVEQGALQALFAEGAPAGGMSPVEVALAKAAQAAAAARSVTEPVEHVTCFSIDFGRYGTQGSTTGGTSVEGV